MSGSLDPAVDQAFPRQEDALAALVTRDSMIGVAKVVLAAGGKP